ncbi:hypothetical protein IJI76_00525 [Candidatus Saccharibacteria bacterium]|nr:hypothetical protein [Candidatus Saccharibacteria bacterium]
MKSNIFMKKVAPLGVGLALSAGLFLSPFLTAQATGFDGKAYLIWECGEDTPCYHLFEDINTDNTYTIYNDSDVTADNHDGKTFSAVNVDTNNTTFALKYAFDAYLSGFTSFTMQDVMTYEDSEHNRLALDPLEAPIEANAYSHFGDRNFKVMIKSPNYIGVSLKNATSGYEPDFGNALNSAAYRDISGSTLGSPVTLYAIPQQDEVIISGVDGAFNSVTAKNLEKASAVQITPVAGGHKIKFNSNYYDRVIFEVTQGSTKKYIRIFRTAIQTQQVDVNPNSKAVNAIVYFDSSRDCDDYNLFAKLEYKNGSNKTIQLAPAEEHDDGYGNINPGCIEEGGTNLKKGYYTAEADVKLNQLSGIYFTVLKAGSTSTSYAGTLSGSKRGIYLNLESLPMTNTNWGKITPEKN